MPAGTTNQHRSINHKARKQGNEKNTELAQALKTARLALEAAEATTARPYSREDFNKLSRLRRKYREACINRNKNWER